MKVGHGQWVVLRPPSRPILVYNIDTYSHVILGCPECDLKHKGSLLKDLNQGCAGTAIEFVGEAKPGSASQMI